MKRELAAHSTTREKQRQSHRRRMLHAPQTKRRRRRTKRRQLLQERLMAQLCLRHCSSLLEPLVLVLHSPTACDQPLLLLLLLRLRCSLPR